MGASAVRRKLAVAVAAAGLVMVAFTAWLALGVGVADLRAGSLPEGLMLATHATWLTMGLLRVLRWSTAATTPAPPPTDGTSVRRPRGAGRRRRRPAAGDDRRVTEP